MTHLVTRLRALADMPFAAVGSCIIPYRDALREAADALDSLQSDRDAHRRCHHDKIIEVDLLKAEIERLRKPPPCEHHRYAESPNGRMRQCRDCFKTASLEVYGWDYK